MGSERETKFEITEQYRKSGTILQKISLKRQAKLQVEDMLLFDAQVKKEVSVGRNTLNNDFSVYEKITGNLNSCFFSSK